MPHEWWINYAPVTPTVLPWDSVIWVCIWVLSTHSFWLNIVTQQVELTHVVPGCPAGVVRSAGLGSKSVSGNIWIKRDLLTTLRQSASDLSPCLIRDFLYTVEMNVEGLWCVWVECLLFTCIVPIALDSHNCQRSRLGLGQQTNADGTSAVQQCSAVLPRLPWRSLDWPYCMHPCLSPVSLPISPSNCFRQCFVLSTRNYILSPPEMQSRFMSKDMTLTSSMESMFAQGLIESAPTNYCTLYNSCNAQWHPQ